jgi:hypothetical protein
LSSNSTRAPGEARALNELVNAAYRCVARDVSDVCVQIVLLAVEEVCSGPPTFRIRLVPEGRNVDSADFGAFEHLLEPLSLSVPISRT